MHEVEVPPGVPQLLRVGEVAKVVNLPVRRVKHWLDKGGLASRRDAVNNWRWIRTVDVINLAADYGLALAWETIL